MVHRTIGVLAVLAWTSPALASSPDTDREYLADLDTDAFGIDSAHDTDDTDDSDDTDDTDSDSDSDMPLDTSTDTDDGNGTDTDPAAVDTDEDSASGVDDSDTGFYFLGGQTASDLLTETGGCACSTGGTPAWGMLVLLALGVAFRRR